MSFETHRPASFPASTVPAVDAEAVTLSSDFTLTRASRALWVGSAGNVVVTFRGGTSVTLAGVGTGVLLPISVTVVKSTANGTTASSIVALY